MNTKQQQSKPDALQEGITITLPPLLGVVVQIAIIVASIGYIILLLSMIGTLIDRGIRQMNHACGPELYILGVADIAICFLIVLIGCCIEYNRSKAGNQEASYTINPHDTTTVPIHPQGKMMVLIRPQDKMIVLTLIITHAASASMAALDIWYGTPALENTDCRQVAILAICFGVTHIVRALYNGIYLVILAYIHYLQ